MIQRVLFTTMGVLAGSALVAHADVKEDVFNAAKKLAEAENYSWRSTVESQGGGRRFGGPTEGKTQKDGLTYLSMTRGDNTIEAVLQGEKGAIKTQDGWQSLSELAADTGHQGQGQRGRFRARMLQNFKAPAAEAQDLLAGAKEITQSGDAFTAELSEEAVRELLSFRRGRRADGGNAPPAATNPKGTVKFWVKDGALSKYEYNVQGTMTFNNNTVDIDRTITVEIRDVGSTKVEVPEEAKSKIG